MRRRTLLRCAPLAALGLAGCLDDGPGTSPENRPSPEGTATPDPTPATDWSTSVAGAVHHEPAVTEDAVHVGTDAGTVHALSTDDGRPQWDATVGDPVAGAPLHDDGTVFVVVGEQRHGADQRVVALDAASGDERWSFAPGWWLTVHGADDRAVYVSTGDDAIANAGQTLYAVDRGDGTERWRAEVGDSYEAAVIDETVAVASVSRLYAIDLSDGSQRWTVDAERVDDPRAANGTVLARVDDGGEPGVRAYDAPSGEERWAFDEWPVPSLTVADAAYAGGERLARLPLDTGAPAWRADGPAFVPDVPVTSDRVLAGGDRVSAYATGDGTKQWTVRAQRTTATHTGAAGDSNRVVPELLVPEAVAGGAVFVRGAGNSNSRQRAYALGLADGADRWSFVADGELTALAGGSGRAYAGSESGNVHAFAATGAAD